MIDNRENPFECHSWGFEVWNDAQRPLLEEIDALRAKIAEAEKEFMSSVRRYNALSAEKTAAEAKLAAVTRELDTLRDALNEANSSQAAAMKRINTMEPEFVVAKRVVEAARPFDGYSVQLDGALAAYDATKGGGGE